MPSVLRVSSSGGSIAGVYTAYTRFCIWSSTKYIVITLRLTVSVASEAHENASLFWRVAHDTMQSTFVNANLIATRHLGEVR